MTPKISILLAINRTTPFLDDAVNSILTQTFTDFEFIIIANGCTDSLYEQLSNYQQQDDRIKLYRTELSGFSFALNYGLNIAKGEYIARMDADDICDKDRLLIQSNFIDNNQVHILGTDCAFINEKNEVIENRKFKLLENNREIRKALPYRNPIIHASMLCPRNILINIGGYKYGHMSEDHELFIRLSRDKNIIFHNLNYKLYSYRRHSQQITDINKSKNNFCDISGFLFTEFLRTYNIKYLLGIIRVLPLLRNFYNFILRRKNDK
ncbi:glycosyltransferase [Morganella morganii]|uniref:glycosyltransferase n=1 Tax=Morganella morganii TaxID=582 RepID=UPI003F1FF01E